MQEKKKENEKSDRAASAIRRFRIDGKKVRIKCFTSHFRHRHTHTQHTHKHKHTQKYGRPHLVEGVNMKQDVSAAQQNH